ncbi:MAG: hypothetical protein J07HX5_01131, partial [halophilic archaeon J07HX5]
MPVALGEPAPLSEPVPDPVGGHANNIADGRKFSRCPEVQMAPRAGADDIGRFVGLDEFPRSLERAQSPDTGSALGTHDWSKREFDPDVVVRSRPRGNVIEGAVLFGRRMRQDIDGRLLDCPPVDYRVAAVNSKNCCLVTLCVNRVCCLPRRCGCDLESVDTSIS